MILASAAELGELAGRTTGVVVLVATLTGRAYLMGARIADRRNRRQSSSAATPPGELKTGEDSYA